MFCFKIKSPSTESILYLTLLCPHSQGPGTAACDLDAVRPVLSTMIDAKIDHLWVQGLAFDARVFTGLRRNFMRGFNITALESSTDDSGGALEAARALFRWRDDTTEKEETRQIGVGLMFWCALADNTDAVRALIAAAGDNAIPIINERLSIHRPGMFSHFHQNVTALHNAASFGSSLTAEVLLEAGADPNATHISGYDIIISASAMFGEPEMFRMWGRRKVPAFSPRSNPAFLLLL